LHFSERSRIDITEANTTNLAHSISWVLPITGVKAGRAIGYFVVKPALRDFVGLAEIYLHG
jgi:hypothetical protein